MFRKAAIVFLFIALALNSELFASEPIRIGLTLGLTGKYRDIASVQMNGFRLWEADVNKKGGILGRKVQVTVHDDRSDPRTAVGLYEKMILTEKIDLVFGPYSSAVTEAVAPLTEKHRYPLLTSGAASDRLWQKHDYRYLFGTHAPASKYTTGFLEMLASQGMKTVAILYAHDPFSEDTAQGAQKWAQRFGLRVVINEDFKNEHQHLDSLVQKMHAAGIEVLVVCGHAEEAVAVRMSLRRAGWYPRAFYATVGPALQKFHDTLKADADLAFTSSQWEQHGGVNPPGCCEFYDAYLKAYKEEPSYHAATAYAAGQLYEHAIQKVGVVDREKIRDVLSTTDAMTILGRYGVDRRGMQVKHFNLVIQWQNGKKVVVWPEEMRTGRPAFK